MFGSNFAANFGIPDFGYQGADVQGGYFGANAMPDPSQNAAPGAAPPVAPASGGVPSPQSPLASSPLAGGPLAPGTGQMPQQPGAAPDAAHAAPAAGVDSPFGRPGV